MFVLGIDPGLSVTGYGLVQLERSGPRAVGGGVIRTTPGDHAAWRLLELHRDLVGIIAEYRPDEVALEQVFVNRNLQTATAVGRASGVAILAAAQAGLEVHEYTPSAVKMSLTGYGDASKAQMQKVVAMRFGMKEPPKPADAADALAIALCHLEASRARSALTRVAR